MKKIMATIAAVAMFGAVLSGCGEKQSKVLNVRVWTSEGATKTMMTEKVDEFNKTVGAKENIKIEYQVISSGMDDMTKSAFENNDGPELFSSSLVAIKQYRKQGYCVPIEELDGGGEYLKSLNLTIPNAEVFIYDGKAYKFPIKSTTGGLVINKDLFKSSGIVDENGEAKAPETWDEVVKDAKIITNKNKNKYGIAFPMKDNFVWGYAMGWAYSASCNNLIEFDFDNQVCDPAGGFELLRPMMAIKKDNSCFPGSESLDNDTLRLQFAEGNIGMFLACSWDVGVLTEQFPAKCDWGVSEYPVLDKNDRYLQSGQVSGTLEIGNSAVKTPEMSKAVMTVFKWLYSDEMLCDMYEKELLIPYKTEIAENADNSKMSKQWVDFCKLQTITREPVDVPSLKLEGEQMSDLCVRIWMGQLSIEDAYKDYKTRATEALKKGIADGSIEPEIYNKKVDNRRK